MKSKIFFLFTLLFAFCTYDIYSQKAQGPGRVIYDVNTVETIVGQIRSIDKIYPVNNSSYGTHMSLFTTTGDITIHLGPGWYIDNQVTQLNADDNVIVTGSRVTYEGNEVIIAKEVTKGGQVLKLRDDNGYPFWAAWRNSY